MADKNKVRTAFGYMRVSTEDQAKEGLSLDSQAERIRAYCIAKGWDLLGIVADAGLSGKNLDRPGVQKIIKLCQGRAIGVVVVVKLDRITRNVRDLGYLLDVFDNTGVKFASLNDNLDTTTATGRLVVNMIGSVAQWEREIIAERTRDALSHKKKNGEWIGRVPFGYRLHDQRLAKDTDSHGLIVKAKRMRRQGKSIGFIAAKLNLPKSTIYDIVAGNGKPRKRRCSNK